MKIEECDELKFKNKVKPIKEELLQYLNIYGGYFLFKPHLEFYRTTNTCYGYKDVNQVHYSFVINYRDKIIKVFNVKYYRALKHYGRIKKFKKLLKCW